MKFDVTGIKDDDEPNFRIGEVYAAGSTNGTTAYWLIVGLRKDGGAHLLGLSKDGRITSTSTYNKYAITSRKRVGYCASISDLVIDIK